MNIWDDEDIFTLWGSFPTGMQRSPVFRGLFDVAKRFYLLFQHHTTGAEAARRRTFLCDTCATLHSLEASPKRLTPPLSWEFVNIYMGHMRQCPMCYQPEAEAGLQADSCC